MEYVSLSKFGGNAPGSDLSIDRDRKKFYAPVKRIDPVAIFVLEAEEKFSPDDANACFIVLRSVLVDLGMMTTSSRDSADAPYRHCCTYETSGTKAGESSGKHRQTAQGARRQSL